MRCRYLHTRRRRVRWAGWLAGWLGATRLHTRRRSCGYHGSHPVVCVCVGGGGVWSPPPPGPRDDNALSRRRANEPRSRPVPPPTEEGRGGLPRTPTWPPVCLSVRGELGPQAAAAAADMTVPAGPAVLVVLLLTRDRLVAGSIVTAPVRPGGNVTLRCDVPLQYETLWFVQRPDATPAVGVAVSKSLQGGLVHRGPDPRLTGELDATAGSVRLRIRDVGEADLALYYCADRVDGRLVVGNGTRLVFPGEGRRTDLEEEEVVRSCMLCWSLLASVLLLGVLGSSAWVYWCRRQKGPNRSGSAVTEGPRSVSPSGPGSAGEPGGGRASAERRRGAGTAQDDDDEALNYATLQIQGGPKRPRSRPPQRAEFSLYSEVEHRRRM